MAGQNLSSTHSSNGILFNHGSSPLWSFQIAHLHIWTSLEHLSLHWPAPHDFEHSGQFSKSDEYCHEPHEHFALRKIKLPLSGFKNQKGFQKFWKSFGIFFETILYAHHFYSAPLPQEFSRDKSYSRYCRSNSSRPYQIFLCISFSWFCTDWAYQKVNLDTG